MTGSKAGRDTQMASRIEGSSGILTGLKGGGVKFQAQPEQLFGKAKQLDRASLAKLMDTLFPQAPRV